ncbi:hypothetical protein BDW66DRAFT_145943 [Aspergillus desertorum]
MRELSFWTSSNSIARQLRPLAREIWSSETLCLTNIFYCSLMSCQIVRSYIYYYLDQ